MTGGALVFMLVSWSCVLGLTFWSFKRLMGGRPPADPGVPPDQS